MIPYSLIQTPIDSETPILQPLQYESKPFPIVHLIFFCFNPIQQESIFYLRFQTIPDS